MFLTYLSIIRGFYDYLISGEVSGVESGRSSSADPFHHGDFCNLSHPLISLSNNSRFINNNFNVLNFGVMVSFTNPPKNSTFKGAQSFAICKIKCVNT